MHRRHPEGLSLLSGERDRPHLEPVPAPIRRSWLSQTGTGASQAIPGCGSQSPEPGLPSHPACKVFLLNRVAHEGIDTAQLIPNADASFLLPNGVLLTRAQPVLTYVVRNLEPYRGFHVFMRSLPAILSRHPHLQVLVWEETT